MKVRRLELVLVLGLALLPAAALEPFWFWDSASQPIDLPRLSRQSRKGLVCCTLWCSFCGSCRRVEPGLRRLHQDYFGEVTVVAIDASIHDTPESIGAYLESTGLKVPVLRDPPGGLADRLKIELTTSTVIFDHRQRIRYLGNFESARAALNELLDGREVSVPTTPLDGCRIARPGRQNS